MSSETAASPKIIDLMKTKEKRPNDADKPFVSLEFFPPRTVEGVKNLHKRMERMKTAIDPLFTDMTWGAGGSTAELSLDICLQAQAANHVANLHMTCTNMPTTGKEDDSPAKALEATLQKAKEGGIYNIVALRGDPPEGQDDVDKQNLNDDFTCALDLVNFIHKVFPERQFGIAVAGYPEGHPNAITEIQDVSTLTERELARSSVFDGKTYCCLEDNYKAELDYLKKKVDAGADLIITQMFFDTKVFLTFIEDCRKWGITVPIVPGLMCINTYGGFCKMTKFCKTRVPETLKTKMDALASATPDQVKEFGIQFGIEQCRALMGSVQVLHFYTLNLEKVVYGILEGLGYTLTHAASEEKVDADAASMVAVGSAWARPGDIVESIFFAKGTIQSVRSGGVAVIRVDSWKLANDQTPTAILQSSQYKKIGGTV